MTDLSTDKIWQRIERRIIREPNTGCWLWTGGLSGGGYAQIRSHNRLRYVHRLAYEHMKGSIPEGMEIDHLCRVHHCCNPDHLEVVTKRENQRRGVGFIARYMVRTYCERGHLIDGFQTVKGKRYRLCRECRRISGLAWARRNNYGRPLE